MMMNAPVLKTTCCLAACLALASCEKKFDPASGAAPSAQVVETGNAGLVSVDHPEQYPLVAAGRIDEPDKLSVTGTVNPDISREIPVISMANGRVVAIRARLDDNVKKGQLLFSVQSPDIANAFDAYLKAVNDEQLANKAYIRAKDLYEHGAIAQAMLEQAEDTEKDAKADLTAAEEQLRIYGVDNSPPQPHRERLRADLGRHHRAKHHRGGGNRRCAFGIGDGLHHRRPELGVDSLRCVRESICRRCIWDRKQESSSTAYPDKVLTGRVSDIGPVLDPTIRTAKVRIQLANPGILKLGMFVTATLASRQP